MKPEQAPIEISKELHELNKKLDRIIALLPTLKGGTILQSPSYPINPYDPVIYTTEKISLSNNPEAHDYRTEYINVASKEDEFAKALKDMVDEEDRNAESRINLPG